MSLKYEIILHWNEEDGAYIAEIPELPGCMADGETYEDALKNIKVVTQEWIEAAQKLGRPIPEAKQRKSCVHLNRETRWKDPIVEEIHKVREKLAKEANYDLHTICENLRKNEKKHKERAVSFEKKASKK